VPSDPRVSLTINAGTAAPELTGRWVVCPWCNWPVDQVRSGMGLMAVHFASEHPDKSFSLAIFKHTNDLEEFRIKVRCGICDQFVDRHGMDYFPTHYLPDTAVMIVCEASGFTEPDVDLILADRREQARPGRYVRPHP